MKDELRQSYQIALEEILEEVKKLGFLWDHDSDTEILVVGAMIDRDESLHCWIKRNNGKYVYMINTGGHFFKDENPRTAANIIRNSTPEGRFYPEQWKDDFYERIKGPLEKYFSSERGIKDLVENEIARLRRS